MVVGLGLVCLVVAVGAGALFISAIGNHAGAKPSGSVIALASKSAAPPSPTPYASPSPSPTEVPTGKFVPTGSMSTERSSAPTTLLPDGRVLIAGGYGTADDQFPTSAELYDPKTGTFSPTGSMVSRHADGTAILLATGKVLIVGGQPDGTAELYDPAAGTFSQTGSAMDFDVGSSATPLRDGRVLVVGGGVTCEPTCTPVAYAELYDPATGRFTPTGSMVVPRQSQTATLLIDGRVLITGGTSICTANDCQDAASAELYDPATGKFTLTGSMSQSRSRHAATLLSDGEVLVAGGGDQSAELYDPDTGAFRSTGQMADNHDGGGATLLRDGRVLVQGNSTVAELYDPSSGTFMEIESPVTARSGGTATRLSDGNILLAGGGGLVSAELYEP
jgi:WD40 repeat protein